MKKYVVEYVLKGVKKIIVEAENEEEALDEALELGDDIPEREFQFESDVYMIGVEKEED